MEGQELYGLQYYSSGTSSNCGYYNYSMQETGNPEIMDVPPPPLPRPPTTTEDPVYYGAAQEQFVSGSSVSDAASLLKRGGEEVSSAIRAKIASHPLYPKLIHAFVDCQKVGAPPEIASLLDEIQADQVDPSRAYTPCLDVDPELDCFMETYCEVLVKFKSDLSRPFDEATSFLNDIETQFNSLCSGASTIVSDEVGGSSDEDVSMGDAEVPDPHRPNEDRELRDKLLRKYSGYISSLKHEFSKKKKKGKLPKEARQILLNWWNVHNKWPYPTETDKVALADLSGLDQKQINNWFINQRKRHWKPAENMQFGVLDGQYGPFFVNE